VSLFHFRLFYLLLHIKLTKKRGIKGATTILRILEQQVQLKELKLLNDKGTQISLQDWRNLRPIDIAFLHQYHLQQYAKENDEHDVIHTTKNIVTFTVYGTKE
jgi:hypothetical protein